MPEVLVTSGGNLGMTAGSWWHFCQTRSSGQAAWYVNGRIVGSVVASTAFTSAVTINFGNNPSGGGSTYDGFYDDIRFYIDRGFDSAGVAALYQDSKAGSPNTLNWYMPKRYFYDIGGTPPPAGHFGRLVNSVRLKSKIGGGLAA
jgi:hypothetical protein